EKAGRAAGSSEFIKQLPSRRGPTRNLAKGTGIEVAEVKGHYLILIWTEFANLHKPSSKSQRQKLESFSGGRVAGTGNGSLSHRMVTGHPWEQAVITDERPAAFAGRSSVIMKAGGSLRHDPAAGAVRGRRAAAARAARPASAG